MKVTIESTEQLVSLFNGAGREVGQARVWSGKTESGIDVQMLVVRVAVDKDDDCSQFERELQEKHAPAVWPAAFDLRLVL